MFGSQTRFLRPASRSLLEDEVERIEDGGLHERQRLVESVCVR